MIAEDISILIVEDSLAQAMMLERTLSRRFANIHRCSSAQAALTLLAERAIDLVISDIVMPLMDGFELCAKMKRDPALKNIPVILLTSLSSSVEVLKSLECGANNFVFKPYREDHLHGVIENTLEPSFKEVDDVAVHIDFAGQKFAVPARPRQILTLLLTTYQLMVDKNNELLKAQAELRDLAQSLEELVTKKSVELESVISIHKETVAQRGDLQT